MSAVRFGNEPILAWRTWLVDDAGYLCPQYRASWIIGNPRAAWDPEGEHRANCPHGNEAPCWKGCGYHAWRAEPFQSNVAYWPGGEARSRAAAFAWRGGWQPPYVLVYGQVSLWGRVREHARGYRAEYAYPYLINVGEEAAELVARLRDRYHVDVSVVSWDG